MELTHVSYVERWRCKIQKLLVWWGSSLFYLKTEMEEILFGCLSKDVKLCVLFYAGGEVTFDLKNDAPTLTGAQTTFTIKLNFPTNQTVRSDGQVVWARNCTINGKPTFLVYKGNWQNVIIIIKNCICYYAKNCYCSFTYNIWQLILINAQILFLIVVIWSCYDILFLFYPALVMPIFICSCLV